MLIAPAASRHSKDTIPARPRRGESPPCGQSALWKKTSTEPVGLHEIFENSEAVIFRTLCGILVLIRERHRGNRLAHAQVWILLPGGSRFCAEIAVVSEVSIRRS